MNCVLKLTVLHWSVFVCFFAVGFEVGVADDLIVRWFVIVVVRVVISSGLVFGFKLRLTVRMILSSRSLCKHKKFLLSMRQVSFDFVFQSFVF